MITIDIWKSVIINGYETNYLVSSGGNVYNKSLNKIMKYAINKHGYCHLSLSINGVRKNYSIHRLVAIAFIPIPDKYIKQGLTYDDLTVNHIDGNKQNNCIDNLEWCTGVENTIHGHTHGLFDRVYGEKSHLSKMSDKTALKCCKMLAKGKSNKEISEKLGISEKSVKSIKSRESWTRISKNFVFPNLNYKVSDENVICICELLKTGKKVSDIADAYKCPIGYVYDIKYARIRKDITTKYFYE